jgi:hypothetical protein
MDTKRIDVGEKIGEAHPMQGSKSQKYYPSFSIPVRINPKLVGKKVRMVIEAKIVGVRENTEQGSGTRSRCEIEVHTVHMPKVARQPESAEYIEDWMK